MGKQDLEGLVVSKGLKGKQNKKKWNKNIDVSGLLNNIEKQNNEDSWKKFAKPLVVEDTTKNQRQDLDPNRFKIKYPAQPKPKYDNSHKREDLIGDGMIDAWNAQPLPAYRKKQQLIVPAVIKPSSGHSYHPNQQHIDQIVDEVIDYEKERPRIKKPIKKIKDVKIVPRARNKKVREQYVQAQQRRKERLNQHKINSMKKLKRQIREKDQKIRQNIENKQLEKGKRLKEDKQGKVRQGPKIGKIRYQYKQHVPTQEQIGKKISKVSQTDLLVKDRFDSIFRRGILEPRTIKVHANKTKNQKVTERFEQ